MTDVWAIAMTTIRRLISLRRMLPDLAVGASVSAMFDSIGDAHRSAYVDPYVGVPRNPDDDLWGRDRIP